MPDATNTVINDLKEEVVPPTPVILPKEEPMTIAETKKIGKNDPLGSFEPVTYILIQRNINLSEADEQWVTVHPKDNRTGAFLTPAPISIKFNYGVFTATNEQDVRKMELVRQALSLTGQRQIKTIKDIESLVDNKAVQRERQDIMSSNLPEPLKKKLMAGVK